MTKPYLLALTAALVLAGGCQPSVPETAETPPEARRVENAALGVAIADLIPFFEVAENEGPAIVLTPVEGEGRLVISAGEPESSINLVAAVEAHQADVESRPGGDYKGGRELRVPAMPGAAFYSRGRYQGASGTVEETTIFFIHPWQDRQLHVTYTYPAGDDSAERLQDQLFAVAGELEGLPQPDEGAAPEG